MTTPPFSKAIFEPLDDSDHLNGLTSFSASVECKNPDLFPTHHTLTPNTMADGQVTSETHDFTDSQVPCADHQASEGDTVPSSPRDEAHKPYEFLNDTQPDNVGGHQHCIAHNVSLIDLPKDSGVSCPACNRSQRVQSAAPHDSNATLGPIDGEMIASTPPQINTHSIDLTKDNPPISCLRSDQPSHSDQRTLYPNRYGAPNQAQSSTQLPPKVLVIDLTLDNPLLLPDKPGQTAQHTPPPKCHDTSEQTQPRKRRRAESESDCASTISSPEVELEIQLLHPRTTPITPNQYSPSSQNCTPKALNLTSIRNLSHHHAEEVLGQVSSYLWCEKIDASDRNMKDKMVDCAQRFLEEILLVKNYGRISAVEYEISATAGPTSDITRSAPPEEAKRSIKRRRPDTSPSEERVEVRTDLSNEEGKLPV